MKISFINNYKSIHQFNETETPDFCVFVGKNGAGKTHLLRSIESGHVKIDNIDKDRVTYFNFQSFLINNQKAVTARNLEDEKDQAWNLFEQLRTNGTFNDNETQTKTQILRHTKNNPKQRCLIETGIYLSGKKVSELDKNTFLKFAEYIPDDYQLLDSLSEICFDYQKRYIIAQLPISNGGEGKTEQELLEINRKSPWHFINRMFETFGLPHKITPPPFTAGDIIKTGNIEYQARPVYDDFEIGFEDLSSGERILCALAITVFQDQDKTSFPELLLLDEVDASLHPSMVKNLLSVINDIFIKNGCKVILATHSPTTASLVDETSVFEIKTGKVLDKIQKISQIMAVEILSEGLMSLEKGIVLFDQISSKPLSIITEGDNIHHLQKAIEITKPELLEKIEFIKGVESGSGKDQLKALFEFFKLATHNNSVLFVFDCDVNVATKLENNNTYIFALPQNNTNTLISKGVENIYPESIFNGFIETSIDSQGTEIRKFDPKRKKDFVSEILKSTNKDDFINYETLIQKIESILNSLNS
jgi:ABC-type cobalamin/Fe3+-siderophores transport system ATPase subunit